MSHVQESGTGARRGAPRKRGPADPVRALMHRHQRLCAEAVDPLEIVAGLEAQGVTDRVAAGFRHRDVFTLAEELYARVPRAGAPPAAGRTADRPALLLTLAPGAVCAAASGRCACCRRSRWSPWPCRCCCSRSSPPCAADR